jgi:hypothetical protein
VVNTRGPDTAAQLVLVILQADEQHAPAFKDVLSAQLTPRVTEAATEIKATACAIDGELVVADGHGVASSSFCTRVSVIRAR